MSDARSSTPVAGRAAPRGLAPRARALGGRAPLGARDAGANTAASSAVLYAVRNMALALAVCLVLAHLAFAHQEQPYAVRLLTAIPGVLLIMEARRYFQAPVGELPFLLLGLLQYYVAFCLPIFFHFDFFDLNGRVAFRDEARLASGTAVALGGTCITASAHAGALLGGGGRDWAYRVFPPERLPGSWDSVFYAHAVMVLVAGLVLTRFPTLIPAFVALPLSMALSPDFSLGLALAAPPKPQGFIGRNIALLVALSAGASGVLRGMLEPMFRAVIPLVAAGWSYLRRLSLRTVAILLALYFMFQPMKGAFRDQVWGSAARTGTEVGYSARVNAWTSSFQRVWMDDRSDAEGLGKTSLERISELDAVTHAFEVLPGRVQFLEGQGLLAVFYTFIPRAIWPDKPTTRDTTQRYGVSFGRQDERGAESTAISLPLLVEGYWNLGWPGIVLVCSVGGFWLGLAQRTFAVPHWALRTMGLVQLTRIGMNAPCVNLVGSVFQSVLLYVVATWVLWGLAKMMSGHDARADGPLGKRRLVGARPLARGEIGAANLRARARGSLLR